MSEPSQGVEVEMKPRPQCGRASMMAQPLSLVGTGQVSAVSYTHLDVYKRQLTASHADWAEDFAKNYAITPDNVHEIVQHETGLVFAKVLEHAGVYKRTPEGQAAFLRYIAAL